MGTPKVKGGRTEEPAIRRQIRDAVADHLKRFKAEHANGVQHVAAEKLGWSQSIYSRYEGKKLLPSVEAVLTMSRVLKISMERVVAEPPHADAVFLALATPQLRREIYEQLKREFDRQNSELTEAEGAVRPKLPAPEPTGSSVHVAHGASRKSQHKASRRG